LDQEGLLVLEEFQEIPGESDLLELPEREDPKDLLGQLDPGEIREASDHKEKSDQKVIAEIRAQ
jgi:hypothetical protein